MIAKWEKRKNGYFAYARYSTRDKETKKTVTVNRYLGSDITTALEKLREFTGEMHMEASKVEDLVHALAEQGKALGIRQDKYVYNNKEFIATFNCKFQELALAAKGATTKKSRENLSSQIIQLGTEVISYINSQKLL